VPHPIAAKLGGMRDCQPDRVASRGVVCEDGTA
jgi:hypothetical protein